MKKRYSLILLSVFVGFSAYSQRILPYNEFIRSVREKNISYLVEKYNIPISQANAKAARVMPDPEIGISYENNQDWSLKMGQGFGAELGYTLELGRKRGARIAVAKSQQQITEALTEDFFRNLRSDATLCYLDAQRKKAMLSVTLSSYHSMRDLAHADSLRYKLGEITEVDAIQTRLEAAMGFNEYIQAESDFRNTLSDLSLFEGGSERIDSLDGDLQFDFQPYRLDDLIIVAQENRADLKASLLSKELSAANLRLAKANRVIDLGLNLGYGYSTVVVNTEAPSPKFNTISAGITIPIKFSAANKGELYAAQHSQKQAEMQYEAVLLQIKNEVEKCYQSYLSASLQAERFKQNALADAKYILEKKKYSYFRGQTSLLEVIAAQRTFDEVFSSYYEAYYNRFASLVELYRAAGIWGVKQPL